MEYKTCEEQLRYIWPFGTGCGRLKLPAFSISLLCNFLLSACQAHSRKSRKAPVSFVCLSVHMYQPFSHCSNLILKTSIQKSVKEIQTSLKSDKNIGSVTWRPKYVRVDSTTKYFVMWQQCKGNPFLHFFGNTQQFYIVDSGICSPAVPSELIVAFPCQEWLHECATVFYYTYVA
jgi:hypothetical protein